MGIVLSTENFVNAVITQGAIIPQRSKARLLVDFFDVFGAQYLPVLRNLSSEMTLNHRHQ
jgi:hypothetical protein